MRQKSAKMIVAVRINVNQIDKRYLYQGAKGKYLNLTLIDSWEIDQYGNHFTVRQDYGAEARKQGVKSPIIGSAKMIRGPIPQELETERGDPEVNRNDRPQGAPRPKVPAQPDPFEADDDDLPF